MNGDILLIFILLPPFCSLDNVYLKSKKIRKIATNKYSIYV